MTKLTEAVLQNRGIFLASLGKLITKEPQLLSQFSLGKKSQINRSIIKNLTKQQAVQLCYHQWWQKYNFGSIIKQAIAIKVLNYSIHMGADSAIKLLHITC